MHLPSIGLERTDLVFRLRLFRGETIKIKASKKLTFALPRRSRTAQRLARIRRSVRFWKERLSPRALVIRRPLSEACCTTRLPRTATPLIGGAGTSSLSTVAARARAGRPRPAQVLRWQPPTAIPAAAFRTRPIFSTFTIQQPFAHPIRTQDI